MKINRQVSWLILILLLKAQFGIAQPTNKWRIGVRVNLAASRLIGDVPTNRFLVKPTFGLDVIKPLNKSIQLTGQILYAQYGNVQQFVGAAPGERYITTYQYLAVPIGLRISRHNTRFSVILGAQWGGYSLKRLSISMTHWAEAVHLAM